MKYLDRDPGQGLNTFNKERYILPFEERAG
jgi:hypothetical protein